MLQDLKMSQILRNNLTRIISSSEINKRVFDIANDINTEYFCKSPLFIGVLNGSFIFLADLVRCLNIDVEISFIKARSYNGKQKSDIIKFDFFDFDTRERSSSLLWRAECRCSSVFFTSLLWIYIM